MTTHEDPTVAAYLTAQARQAAAARARNQALAGAPTERTALRVAFQPIVDHLVLRRARRRNPRSDA